jgi:hypothetical protein
MCYLYFIAADLVHFPNHVQTSHVIYLHLCVADLIVLSLPCMFLFILIRRSYFLSQGQIFATLRNSLLGSGGGGCTAPS